MGRRALNLDAAVEVKPEVRAPRPDREGKALIGTMVPKSALYQFGELASKLHKGNGELLRDLINEAFRANKMPPIA